MCRVGFSSPAWRGIHLGDAFAAGRDVDCLGEMGFRGAMGFHGAIDFGGAVDFRGVGEDMLK
jgi:hypothetical protein